MSMNYKTLTELSEGELIRQYDQIAESTCVGLDYYTEEIAHRRNEKSNRLMVHLTLWITIMTAIMLLSTIVNVVIAIVK